MPAFTPNFNLPYPTATDDPCEFAEQWCAFTAAVQTVLDGFQASADRTNPVIPVTQLRMTAASTVVAGTTNVPVPFDAVTADTAGWSNFDSDNTTITVDRAGRMFSHASLAFHATSGDDGYFLIETETLSTACADTGTGISAGGNLSTYHTVNSTRDFGLNATRGSTSQTSINFAGAEFDFFWIADEVNP